MTTLFGPDRGSTFTVSSVQHDDAIVVHIGGELDLRSVPILREHLRRLWGRSGLTAVIMDMADLSFCDSVGLSELIAAMKRSEALRMRFVLSGVHGVLTRVLNITGLGRTFETYDTAEEALRRLTS
ncbi:anti-sigma factor antagonist [Planobispora takensis]|uniref:Anti-sigma factor antagonist n=1 Tax=Planobispora takensis TaxID=1367882 RepID=A0A8J3T052_9ACTN|nr:anti-sigma factor antagonist [Planobispora takensis]GII02547.1 anti-sigma-F factor antagonist RsfB [Planobispora takensis]